MTPYTLLFTGVVAFVKSGGRKFLRNIETFTADYTASHLTSLIFIVTTEVTSNFDISDVYYSLIVCGFPLSTHKIITESLHLLGSTANVYGSRGT